MKNKYNKKSNKEKNGIILPETDNINNDVNQTVDVSEDNSENVSSSGHKKKGKRILLWILIVLLIAILAVCIRFWHVLRLVLNWENISAYRNSQKYTKEEIVEKMEENNAEMEKIVKEDDNINLRPKPQLTDEESKALEQGLITYEDAVKLVMDQVTLEELLNSKSGQTSETTEQENTNTEEPGKNNSSNNPASSGNGTTSGSSSGVKEDTSSSDKASSNKNSGTSGGKTDSSSGKITNITSNKNNTGKTNNTTSKPDSGKTNNTTSKPDSGKTNSTASKPDSGKTNSTTSKPDSGKTSNTSGNKTDTGSGGTSSSEETAPEPQDRVSQLVAELYVVQADFMNRLEAIGDSAYADYKATHYDRSQVMTIVDSYTATVGALESECDKKVNSLIKELNAELDKIGGDKTLAKDIQKYYYTEKSLKKSYYLDRLNDEDYK